MLQVDGGTLAGSTSYTSSSPSPSVLQALFAQWAREYLGLRGQLCLASSSSLCMHMITSMQKASSKSSGTHSQLSWRERNREEKQGLPQTGTNTSATSATGRHQFPNAGFLPQMLEEGRAPGQMRSSLGQWKEDIDLLMCNEAEPKNLLKTKEKQPGQ